MLTCSVCGGTNFSDSAVLWDELVTQWRLSPEERRYVDRQQGTKCTVCGSNLRSIALANAIRNALATEQTLQAFASSHPDSRLSVLEVNEAGSLSPILKALPGHILASYPEVDMHAMPYATGVFDLVVHSDTLEHVEDPVRALKECRRVLRSGGHLCFTIPTIVARLTKFRAGLEKSYHGDPTTLTYDFAVHTEFGADMWTAVLQAGFSAVTVHAVDYPSALALSARQET